jgi:hypothetical protein
MKRLCGLTLLILMAMFVLAPAAFAKVEKDIAAAPKPGDLIGDVPARAPSGFARPDTVTFGYYQVIGGTTYAVEGDMWTWDHGAPDPLEGWYAMDATAAPHPYFQQITAASWSGHVNQVQAPIINGAGSAWCGIMEDEARLLCWDGGLGYGNLWCQRLTSPSLTYGGTGTVGIGFSYFNDTEFNYDYTKTILAVAGGTVILNDPGFTSKIGTPPTGPWASYSRTITQGELGGAGQRPFTIRFEFTSDVGWSDQDGSYTTAYGPFGVDDVSLTGDIVGGNRSYNFDADLQGWTATSCPGVGSFFAVHPLSDYIIQDPCVCRLSGNVVGMHDDLGEHPANQHESSWSPIVDHRNFQAYNHFLVFWDQYAQLPQANGVVYRPGFRYYPYVCPASGATQWSGRQGQDVWYYTGDQPACYRTYVDGQAWGIPSAVDYLGFVYEISYDCNNCSGITNFTPIWDNVQIRLTGMVNAPGISFDVGAEFQDGFSQTAQLDVLGTGNADIVRNLHYGNPPPNDADKLGDSLVVNGPVATASTRWEAKLWFRVKREGPGQLENTNYIAWKQRVRKGLQIVGPNGAFTYGYMDSVEVAAGVYRNKFCSRYREGDPASFGSEMSSTNEILMDGIYTPGTKIDYFVTGNYICTPTVYAFVPDTTGKFYSEFEILPSYRNDHATGYYKMPCILYVDAFNLGSQFYIENALNRALNGAVQDSAEIPDPTSWDRYDYKDGSSNWKAPLFRNTGGDAGATVAQLLGYKTILVSTGTYPTGCMETRDWQGFDNWFTAVTCGANTQLQGWWGSGSDLSQIIAVGTTGWPQFMTDLGATAVCDKYYEPGCPPGDENDNDQQYCVRLNHSTGPYAPTVPIDVFGNWCPPQYSFDVLGTQGTGVGNLAYQKIPGGYIANYAQITNDQSAAANKYRTVLEGYSLHQLSRSTGSNDPTNGPNTDCPNTVSSIVEGSYADAVPTLQWLLNTNNLLTLGLCVDPCLQITTPSSGVDDNAALPVNRLYQNSPNPFNPRTTISYSLAVAGPAKLAIYDVNGRLVRTLADGLQAAGPHTLVWDGTDDLGHRVASGIYWSQLSAGDYSSNKKMVVLR